VKQGDLIEIPKSWYSFSHLAVSETSIGVFIRYLSELEIQIIMGPPSAHTYPKLYEVVVDGKIHTIGGHEEPRILNEAG